MSNTILNKAASVCILLTIFGFQNQAIAAEMDRSGSIEARAYALNERVEGIMGEARVALFSAGDHLARGMEEGEAIAHAYFKRQVLLTRGLRAILGLNAEGFIVVDSYSSPPPKVNLKKRNYFVDAQKPLSEFTVHNSVVGKTSGVPFIPVAMPRLTLTGRFLGVVVGIMHPDRLLGRMFPCRDCVMSVVRLGEDAQSIVSRPAQLIVPATLVAEIAESSNISGVWRRKFGTFPMIVAWHKSDRFGLVSIYAEPDGDLVRMSND